MQWLCLIITFLYKAEFGEAAVVVHEYYAVRTMLDVQENKEGCNVA
jgi:hypothetical protein